MSPEQGGAKKTISGIIQVTRKGVGYVPWPLDEKRIADAKGGKVEKEKEDIEIPTEKLGGALNGDLVEVALGGLAPARGFKPRGRAAPAAGNRYLGTVALVVERAKTEFVCTLKHENNRWIAVADDARVYRPFHIAAIPPATKEGTKVLVRLISFYSEGDPTGEIIEVIGAAGEHRTEMNAIVLEHGFRVEFPAGAAGEAKEIEERHAQTIAEEIPNRSDYRDVTTFTIDPASAKDFDDALSIQEFENGDVEIGVHIADVTFFVRPGSALEEEVQKRGTSVYLVDATIPMLPHELSGNVCSLMQGEDRLAFAAIFRMRKSGEVLERRFERTVINSNKRFTYEEAQEILNKLPDEFSSDLSTRMLEPELGMLEKGSSENFARELLLLRDLARILKKQRAEEGAIDFGDNEVRFDLDGDGKPLSVARKERIETNSLIEEFMLLANREVALHVSKLAEKVPEKNLIFLYRIHDEPKADRIEELSTFVHAVGYDFKKSKKTKYSARDIADLLQQIEGKPEEHLIRTATLRSMAKAIYSTKNIGHFGLAFEYYTHFTSPIRRYPDMLVHRILQSHIRGAPMTRREFDHLERLCIAASEQEAKAVDAERDSIRYKLVEYMSGKVGQTFEGVISGVTDWGLYVEEKESSAEGLVRVRSLGGDFYTYQQKAYALVGERTKKKFTLGDPVNVKLVAADLTARTLDFELVSRC